MNESKYVLIGVLGIVFLICASIVGYEVVKEKQPGVVTIGDKVCTLVLKPNPSDADYTYETYECEDK